MPYRNLLPDNQREADRSHPGKARHRRRDLASAVHPRHRGRYTRRDRDFLAPPSSAAKELLAAEPRVAATIYFEHSGSELRRGINLIRLVGLMRRQRPRAIWILDRTIRPALAQHLLEFPNASASASARKISSLPIRVSVRIIFTIIRSTGCAL